MSPQGDVGDRRLAVAGILGYCSLTAALLLAHANPATEYELSIYAATPDGFWIGCAVAFVSALLLSFSARRVRERLCGVVLGGLTSTAVFALPIIRGYTFHGVHDSVTHVGITRELTEGTMTSFDTIYPGIHSTASFVGGLTGFSPWQSLLLVPLVTAVAFYVFVPLTVREIVGGETATVVGAFSAFLLLPIHQLASTPHPHPSSQAILFAPIVLFLLVRYLRATDTTITVAPTPAGAALFVAVLGAILYHPQQAVNVIALLVVIPIVQFVTRWIPRLPSPPPWHRSAYPVASVSVLAYLVWVTQFPGFFAVYRGAVSSMMEFFLGSETVAGSAVGSQAGSLRAIGSGLGEIYFKLFSVSTVYLLVTGLVVLLAFSGRFRETEVEVDSVWLLRYTGVSLVPMLLIFSLYYFGDVGQYYFRQAAFMMLVATVLGAVGIVYWIGTLSVTRWRSIARSTAVVAFAIMLLLSTLIIFNSPYMYRANQQVTEAKVSGYESIFGVTNGSATFTGIREQPQRYYQAIVDARGSGPRETILNGSDLPRLSGHLDRAWYLVISQNTYEREIEAYRELRYSRSDLEAVERQARVNRVFSNGDVDVYHVP